MQKILVVEDEPAINELIVGTLDLSDFDVVQAYDTQGAYVAVVDEKPDLILLDWMMPHGESGIDFARRLKKTQQPLTFLSLCSPPKVKKIIKFMDWMLVLMIILPSLLVPRELISRVKAVLRRTGIDMGKELIGGQFIHQHSQSKSYGRWY